MVPKKMILFGLLVLLGVGYLLKDANLNKLQSEDMQKHLRDKEKARAVTADNPDGDPNLVDQEDPLVKAKKEAQEKGYRFLPGQCVSNRADGWEFTKILGIGKETYKIIDCHKYKGCTEEKEISWQDIEFEYRQGRLVPCSR